MLSNHPANLLLRFTLEIVSLVALGQWGLRAGDGLGPVARWLPALGLPLIAALVWAVFRAEEPALDGTAHPKHAVVRIPGRLRLAFELAFFTAAALALFAAGSTALALAYIFALLLHHFWSFDRVVRLARSR